jgi:hypothetical protein
MVRNFWKLKENNAKWRFIYTIKMKHTSSNKYVDKYNKTLFFNSLKKDNQQKATVYWVYNDISKIYDNSKIWEECK